MTWQRPGEEAKICDAREAGEYLRLWLRDPAVLFIGANVAFDFAVAAEAWPDLRPLIFAAYEEDRVTDVQIRQRLLDIAGGVYMGRFGATGVFIKHTYDLEALAKRIAGMQLVKDAWRLSYGEFIGVPLKDWPKRAVEVQAQASEKRTAIEYALLETPGDKGLEKASEGLRSMINSDPNRCTEYPLDDARATLAVWEKQEVHTSYLADQYRQARGYFALHLGSAWGLRTDAPGVEILRRETQAAYDALEGELRAQGILREDGTRDTKLAKRIMLDVCAREGITVRRTDGHADEGKCKKLDGTKVEDGAPECEDHVCLDEEACKATDDETLKAYAKISTLKKVLSNDIPALSGGTEYPLSTRYGLAETGRTTSSKPNIQNLRRLVGIREAFVPRPAHVFVSADYPQLELYTLAQCCKAWLGTSKLADALNAGMDPHLALAARIFEQTYEEVKRRYDDGDTEVEDVRHLAKQGNFGLPGGMGIAKFEKLVRVNLKPEIIARLGVNEARLKLLKQQWFETWPEMPHYFARVNALCSNDSGKAVVETLYTKRFRAGATYCAACNNGFQALGADCAKNAGWLIAKEQYVDIREDPSPLFDTRTVAFVHDEFILEAPDDDYAHDVASRLADVMVEGANIYLPDVPIPRAKLKPLLMRRWSKKAKPLFDSRGRLIPWGKESP